MAEQKLKNLNYKTKAKILLGDETLDLKEIGKSWLCVEKDNTVYFVKTIELNDNQYSFSYDQKLFDKINEYENNKRNYDIKIFIGAIFENCIQKLQLVKLNKIAEVQTPYIRLNDQFQRKNSSHLDFEIASSSTIHANVNIDLWVESQTAEQRVYSLATTKRINEFNRDESGDKNPFINWYKTKEKKCCYCGVKEENLITYFNEENKQYFIDEDNKARQRGKYLEIERLVTAGDNNIYSPENIDLACYICNNAKSDFISPKFFKPIAEGIYNFWKNKIGIKDIEFPKKSPIWEKE